MRKVMIIDDETQVLNSLQRYLVRNKWRVISFNHPKTALDYAKYGFFPVVISDYRMPEMNGVDFLALFQELQPYTYKIMLSGQADQNAMIDAINIAGVDHFLHKPWNNEKLTDVMESGLSAIQNKLRRDNQINKKSLSKDDYLEWHRKLLEKSSPGITQVKRNAMGWIEIDN